MKKKDNALNIAKIDLGLIVDELLSQIKKRQQQIMTKRFGLDGKKPLVLEKIGQRFGVTRERIRQIEVDSFRRLALAEKSALFDKIISQAKKNIVDLGDFCEKKELKKSLKKNLSELENNQLMFILNSSAELVFKKGSLKFNGFWCLKENDVHKTVLAAHNLIVKLLEERRKPVRIGEIIEFLQNSQLKSFFPDDKAKQRVEMICLISRQIDRNIIDQWGLKKWKAISQRGSREKAYLVLCKEKQPLHFKKITELINYHWEGRATLSQTVHNELIKDKRRFVLVGRGIYGLSSWGLVSGTVREVIIKYLEKENRPLDKETITQYVLAKKRVKPATVAVTLANREFFIKTKEGLFKSKNS